MRTANPPRVVVGLSGSLNSLTALHRAATEARLTGRKLLAVLAYGPRTGARYPYQPASLTEQSRHGAVEQLITALEGAFGASGDDLPVEGLVLRGRPGPILLDVAHRADDILVVGAGHRGWLSRALMPSVARYCLAHAACPVLAVPPSPLQRDLEAIRRSNRRLATRGLGSTDIQDLIS
ncbi:universal stress protein [Streptomyces avermitilis]|uniref:universal stress protein n=1 Tax=Streptomyces avermitilis TaxID=33903 RepID=UPI0033BBC18C